jgi:hypothetical protein
MKDKITFIALKAHLSGKISPRYIPILNEDNLIIQDRLKKTFSTFEKFTISLPLDKQNDIYRDIIMMTYTCCESEINALFNMACINGLDNLSDQLCTHRENWENWEVLEQQRKDEKEKKEWENLMKKIEKEEYTPNSSSNSSWCPACHESPCMCSDPW